MVLHAHRELSWVYHVESTLGKSKMGLELSSCKGFRPGKEGRPYVTSIDPKIVYTG